MSLRTLPPEIPERTDRKTRPGLVAWIRAWRNVILDPYAEIPRPPLPAEGEPIPADLDLHCPDCGEPFTVQRAWTHKIERTPEYILRYRFDPGDTLRVIGIACCWP